MPLLIIGTVILLAMQPASQPVGRGPEPSPMPVSWELDLRFLDPQRIEVQAPGAPGPEVYWYMVYTVTNHTGRTQRFFPTFQLVTDDLRVVNTDMGISALVFDAIRERHRYTHPDLVHPTKAIGDLLTGDDNALESVAIWRGVDSDAHSLAVYVAGLCGEARQMKNPTFDPARPEGPENPKQFTLRKTLEIRYNLPGDAAARALVEPERVGVRWLMR
jgi:hypothetical protein